MGCNMKPHHYAPSQHKSSDFNARIRWMLNLNVTRIAYQGEIILLSQSAHKKCLNDRENCFIFS